MRNKICFVILLIAALATTFYLLMLGYYALPTADDWGWTQRVSENGVFEFVKSFYFSWQGRYSGLFVDGLLCKWFGRDENLLIVTLVQLFLGYGGVYLLLRDMARIPQGSHLAITSILVTNLGIMAFPNLGTFYWLCTSNYIHEIWLTMYLVWFIFCCKNNWLKWLGTILCAIYLGGCSENYSPVLAMSLGILWLLLLYKNSNWKLWQSDKMVLLLLSTCIVGIGSLAMIMAPGNAVRTAEEAPNALMKHFDMQIFYAKSVKASAVLLLRILSRGWYFVCAAPLLIYIGRKSTIPAERFIWKKVLLALGAALTFVVVSVMATVYGVGWYATMRANCFVIFIMMAWWAYACIWVGIELKQCIISKLYCSTIGGSIAIIATAIIYVYQEYPMVRYYHKEVVAINHQMQKYVEEGRTETVYIHPVKISYRQSSYGYMRNAIQMIFHKSKRYNEHYFPYEPFVLTDDVTNWRNVVYRYWLNAQFDVICIDESVAEENIR